MHRVNAQSGKMACGFFDLEQRGGADQAYGGAAR